MSFEDQQLNHIVRNNMMVARILLKNADYLQADQRLAVIEATLKAFGDEADLDKTVRLIIMRLEQTQDGALGSMLFDGRLFCTTLEPDTDDLIRSQIPAGIHPLQHFSGTRFKNTLEVIVPGHTAVLFHNGSLEEHTLMCVLVGYVPTYLMGKTRRLRAIIDSRRAYKQFQAEVVPQIRAGDKAAFINLYFRTGL